MKKIPGCEIKSEATNRRCYRQSTPNIASIAANNWAVNWTIDSKPNANRKGLALAQAS
jgi:hypothetical protein